MGHFVTPLIYGALAGAAPNDVQADSGMMNLITFQGRRRDQRAFSALYFASGGFGALRGLDGWSTMPHPSNMAVVPVEIWETLTNTTILEKRLLPDSGGAGQWRGGLGQQVLLRNDTGDLVVMLGMGNRTAYPAKGISGGGDGTLRQHQLADQPVHAKGRVEIGPGEVVRIIEAGGAGFGDPLRRDREAIDDDISNGLVSVEAAERDYGWSG